MCPLIKRNRTTINFFHLLPMKNASIAREVKLCGSFMKIDLCKFLKKTKTLDLSGLQLLSLLHLNYNIVLSPTLCSTL